MNEVANILTFSNDNFGDVRLFKEGEDFWFVAKDICSSLGLNNVGEALKKLDEDEKSSIRISDGTSTKGGNPNMSIVNESGLYNLVLRSHKPEAKRFRKWITSEVLPSIRKHGMYAVDELLDNPDLAIRAFQALKEERGRRIEAERKNAILMHHSKMYTATEIAKEVGLKSANELNKILEEKGIQYKVNGTWVPTADYADLGYFHIKQEVLDNEHETVIYHRKITQDGRAFLVNLLVKKDEPLFEKENTEELFE